ncbi:MAG: hypothetical protein IJE48_04605, partial [Clostridia bacterium]|nr:hypothetical protein [Clostridia bacterium]
VGVGDPTTRIKNSAGVGRDAFIPPHIFFVYLTFFLPSEYLCTPSVEENAIQLPFSTVTTLPKNKFFDKLTG